MSLFKRILCSRIPIVCIILCYSISLHGQTTVTVISDTVFSLSPYTLIHQDPNTVLTLEKVKSLDREAWNKGGKINIRFDPEIPVGWFKFRVNNKSGSKLRIYFPNVFLSEIELFFFEERSDRPYQSIKTGMIKGGANDRGMLYSSPVPVSSEVIEVYGRTDFFSNYTNGLMGIKLGTESEIIRTYSRTKAINIGLVSIIVGFLVFNLIIFFFVKDSIYIFYILYIAAALTLQLYVTDIIFTSFWPSGEPYHAINWPLSFVYISLILFISELFSIRTRYPLWYKIIIALMILPILPLFGFTSDRLNYWIYEASSILSAAFVVSAGILSWKKMRTISIFFFVGWAPLVFMAYFYLLVRIEIVFNEFLVNHITSIAFAWEILIFSLTLGYKFNQTRKEKLAEQEKNIQLIKKYNQELEQQVADRTEEIRSQNEELTMLNEELNMQQEELTVTNEELINHVNKQEQLADEKDKIILVINQYVAGPFKRVKNTLKELVKESDRVIKNRMIKDITADIEATENLMIDIYDENSLERDSFQLNIEEVHLSEKIYEILNETPLLKGANDFLFDDVIINTDSELFGRMVKNLVELMVIIGNDSISISTREEVSIVKLIFDIPEIQLHPKVVSLDDLVRYTPEKIQEQRPLQLRISLVVAICKRLNYDSKITPKDSGVRIVVDVSKEEHFDTISSNKKYLDDGEAKEIYDLVLKCLANEKIYTDPNLTINQLSEKLSIHSKKISYSVNLISGNNFQNFINTYRVREAKQQLLDPSNAHLSYMAIGYDAGFNSKSAFYSAFKKLAGLSPKEYIDEHT